MLREFFVLVFLMSLLECFELYLLTCSTVMQPFNRYRYRNATKLITLSKLILSTAFVVVFILFLNRPAWPSVAQKEHPLFEKIDKYSWETYLPSGDSESSYCPNDEEPGSYFFKHIFETKFQERQNLCSEVLRVGGHEDGSKLVCLGDLPKTNCVVYSFGSRMDFSFEIDLKKSTGCDIYTFDCTIGIPTERVPDFVKFLPWCISNKNVLEFYTVQNITTSSISIDDDVDTKIAHANNSDYTLSEFRDIMSYYLTVDYMDAYTETESEAQYIQGLDVLESEDAFGDDHHNQIESTRTRQDALIDDAIAIPSTNEHNSSQLRSTISRDADVVRVAARGTSKSSSDSKHRKLLHQIYNKNPKRERSLLQDSLDRLDAVDDRVSHDDPEDPYNSTTNDYFFNVTDPSTSNSTYVAVYYTLHSIMKKLGHSSIDLLKLDVERFEFDVIEEVDLTLFPQQLLVEVHVNNLDAAFEGSITFDRWNAFWTKLYNAGYGTFAYELNPFCPCCSEYSLRKFPKTKSAKVSRL